MQGAQVAAGRLTIPAIDRSTLDTPCRSVTIGCRSPPWILSGTLIRQILSSLVVVVAPRQDAVIVLTSPPLAARPGMQRHRDTPGEVGMATRSAWQPGQYVAQTG